MKTINTLTLCNYFGTGNNITLTLLKDGLAKDQPMAITGPNGYGKTLILKLISELLDERCTEYTHIADVVTLTCDSGEVVYECKNEGDKPVVTRTGTLPQCILVKDTDEWNPEKDSPITYEEKKEVLDKFVGGLIPEDGSRGYSAGYKRLICIYRAAKRSKEEGKVLLIDYAESNIHMFGQIIFSKEIKHWTDQQVVVTTHSPQIFEGCFNRTDDLYRLLSGAPDDEDEE
jgi:ABC-type transport system involved in cytochrome c biogenesis ATPase subunit